MRIKELIRPLTSLVFLLAIIVNCVILPLTVTMFSPANANDSHLYLSDGFWIAFGAWSATYAYGRTREKLSQKD